MLTLDDQPLQLAEQLDKVEVDLNPAYAQFRDQTRFWIQRVAVPLLMVIGLFGNSITMIIMTRRRMRSTTNMYLAALAFVDMLYLILTFLLGLSHYPNMASYRHYLYWKLKPFLMMLTDACSNTSVWLTVTFTIERYIAVKFPIKGKLWCTEARAKMLIISVFVLGILFSAPVPFEWQVIEKNNLDFIKNTSQAGQEVSLNDEKITLTLENTDFGRNETYKTIYYWSTAVIFYFIPLFSLMLFNGFLILSVHQSRKERTRMTRRTAPSTFSISSPTCALPPSSSDSKRNFLRPNRLNSNHTSSAEESSNQIDSGQSSPLISPSSQAYDGGNCPLNYPSNQDYYRVNNNGRCGASKEIEPNVHIESVEVSDRNAGGFKSGLKAETMQSSGINGPTLPLGTWVVGQSEQKPVKGLIANSDTDYELPGKKSQSQALAGKLNHEGARHTISTAEGLIQACSGPSKRPSKLNTSTTNCQPAIIPASTQERRITIMLIAVVILFLVCQIPSAAMLLYTSVREIAPNTNEHALVLAFGNIFNFLMAINAAGNFILYSLLSKKYRRTFVIIFCCCVGSKYAQKGMNRMTSVRFEISGNANKNQTSFYHNVSSSDRARKDTPV